MTRRRALLLILSLLPASAVTARGDDAPSRVDALFAPWNRPGSPGAAVAVVRGGKVVLARGYGAADLEHDVPITPQTVFSIASVTKQFTAFAVARLAAEGRLALDDDIRKHLPELNELGKTVTIRHLLHHASGLRDYGGLLVLAGGREGDVIAQAEVLKLLLRQRELNAAPGEEFAYANANYVLLATIVERVSKASYRAWMVTNVFGPLGMSRSEVGDDLGRVIRGRAFSYEPRPGEVSGFKTLIAPITAYGDGNLHCSVEDLALWLANLEAPRAGDAAAIRQMHEPGGPIGGVPSPYALGLFVEEHRGLKLVGHGGAWAGYRSYAGRFPDHGLGVVVLSNLESFDAQGMAMRVAEIYLAGQMKPEANAKRPEAAPGGPEPAREPAQRVRPIAAAAADPAAYTGQYVSPELDIVYELVTRDGELVMKVPRCDDIRLRAVDADSFEGVPFPPFRVEIHFKRGRSGRITGFRATTIGVRNLRFDRRELLSLGKG